MYNYFIILGKGRQFNKKSKGKKMKDEELRLQKYLANAGIASRRKCEEYIEEGLIEVNGKKITERENNRKQKRTCLYSIK